MPVSRRVRVLAAAAVVATGAGLVLLGAPGTAQAAPPPAPRYAAWTVTGTTTDYAGTVDLGEGFPATAFTTDSRTPPGASAADPSGAVGSGATVWLPAGSSFGAVYGSSRAQPYLSLRPRADNAGSPSTTTYTFDRPTPVGTWSIALGDIDAEVLTVTATDATGGPVTGTDLGVTAFNYCDASPRSSSCSGQTTPYVLPAVTVAAGAVSAQDPLCPPTDCDTQGASVSVQPSVALRTLTVTSTWKQGFPAYQTWFATQRAVVTGTVVAPCALPAAPTVRLVSASGTVLATTTAGADGAYAFDDLAAGDDYRVDLDPAALPAGTTATTATLPAVVGAVTAPAITVTRTYAVTGEVTGSEVAGLTVGLTPQAGGTGQTTTTTSTGAYTFTAVTPGTYTVMVPAPTGTEVTPAERDVTVGCAAAVLDPFTLTTVDSTPTPPTTPPTTPVTTSPASAPSTGDTSTTVLDDPTAATTTSAGVLAATGAAPTLPALAGVLLVATGGVITVTARNRRRWH